MRIVRALDHVPAAARGPAVALGNFDGVHRGHQGVLDVTRAVAAKLGAPFGVLTFEPHPRQEFRPQDPPFRLTPLRAKALRLRALGLDALYVARFDRTFSQRTADAFVRDVLVAGMGVRHVVTGEDFAFGHQRRGTAALLQEWGARAGFGVTLVAPVGGADAVKSSRVRALLNDGKPAEAAAMLGDWWRVVGRVRPGDARGRTLGYPTANLLLGDLLRPRFGVYAARATVAGEGKARPAVASLGVRPMFGGIIPLLEVHLFDYAGDLYGRELCIDVIEYLRPEATFTDLPALVRQMDADSARARAVLADPAYAADRFRAATG